METARVVGFDSLIFRRAFGLQESACCPLVRDNHGTLTDRDPDRVRDDRHGRPIDQWVVRVEGSRHRSPTAEATDSNTVKCRFESDGWHDAKVAQRQRQQVENLYSEGSNPSLGTTVA